MPAPVVAAVASVGGSVAAKTGLKALLAKVFSFLLKNPSTCYAAYLTTREVIKSGRKGNVSDGQFSDLIDRYDGISQKWKAFNVESGDITDDVSVSLINVLIETKLLQREMESKLNRYIQTADSNSKVYGNLLRDNIYTILSIVTDAVSERISYSTKSFNSESSKLIGLSVGVQEEEFKNILNSVVRSALRRISKIDIDDLVEIAVVACNRLRTLVKSAPQSILLTTGAVKLNFARGSDVSKMMGWAPFFLIPTSRINALKATPPDVWQAIEIDIPSVLSNWLKSLSLNSGRSNTRNLISQIVSHLRESLAQIGIAPVMNVDNLDVLAQLFPFASGINDFNDPSNSAYWSFKSLSEFDRINKLMLRTYDIDWADDFTRAWSTMSAKQDMAKEVQKKRLKDLAQEIDPTNQSGGVS